MPGIDVDPIAVAGSSEKLINEAMARWYNIKEHKSDLLMADMVQWPPCAAQSFDQNTGLPTTGSSASAPSAAPATSAILNQGPELVGSSSSGNGSSAAAAPSNTQTSGTGNVAIQTGQTVQFVNKGPFSGKWILQRARFELNDGSLKTTVKFRKCLKPSDYPTLTEAGAILSD
jgi:hypothetical protein